MTGTLTVRGRGAATAAPDEVEIVLEAASVRHDVAAAFSDVTERAAALEAVCDELGIATSARRTTNVSVHEYQEHDGQGRPVAKHRAVSRLTLRLADPTRVPRLLRSAVERAHARVEGPVWRLAAANPARLEACRLAVADASARAEAYAAALGRRLGTLERAVETSAPEPMAGAPVFGRVLAAELPIHSADLEVVAVIELTYALEDV